jgi:hypothetical protein
VIYFPFCAPQIHVSRSGFNKKKLMKWNKNEIKIILGSIRRLDLLRNIWKIMTYVNSKFYCLISFSSSQSPWLKNNSWKKSALQEGSSRILLPFDEQGSSITTIALWVDRRCYRSQHNSWRLAGSFRRTQVPKQPICVKCSFSLERFMSKVKLQMMTVQLSFFGAKPKTLTYGQACHCRAKSYRNYNMN